MSKAYSFQGWYFKCSSQDKTIAVIVGSAKEEIEKAFIQIIISGNPKSYYIPYKADEFCYTEAPFSIRVGANLFTEEYMHLDIMHADTTIHGCVYFDACTPLPETLFQKGLMGPFGYLPFMECYHDVLSMNHTLWGQLIINGEIMNFQGEKGYIERDWGDSFPTQYVWMQCNHFKEPTLSVMLAVADIPFIGCNFTGFLCAISIKGKVRIFATYTGAKLEELKRAEECFSVQLRQGKEIIRLTMYYQKGHMLKAPNKGAMKCSVYEDLEATMQLQMYYKEEVKVNVIGKQAAFERVGKVEEINHKIGFIKHMNR